MAIFSPGGATLKMSGYAPAFKKSVEKGPFSTIRRRRRLFKKGVLFSGHRPLGVPEQPISSTFRVANFARRVANYQEAFHHFFIG